MRVGEAPAAKIRHRVGLAPDDVVENPEAEILQDRADAEDVVIGADDDDRRVALHHPAHGGEPAAGERVVIGEIGEFVPIVVDRVDDALVRARQRALELQVVRRVGENEVDAAGGQLFELGYAIADDDGVHTAAHRPWRGASARSVPSTQNLKLGRRARRPGTGRTHVRNHSTLLPETTPRRSRYGIDLGKSRVSLQLAAVFRFRTP